MKIVKILLGAILFTGPTATGQEKIKLLSDPGVYIGGNWSRDTKMNFVPQVWFYAGNFYVEGRYNYEDEKTYSVHLGRPFEIPELKMEVTPTVGLVFGNFKGYSLGLNTDVSAPKIAMSSENQYCFSPVNTNFFFSWLKATTPVIKNFNLGASWQYNLDPSSHTFDVGPMISFSKNGFEFEFFAYNPWKETRYWQFGVSFDLGARE